MSKTKIYLFFTVISKIKTRTEKEKEEDDVTRVGLSSRAAENTRF